MAFAPPQVPESVVVSMQWLEAQKIALPACDSGVTGQGDGDFRVEGGGTLPDRAAVLVFPGAVVLDRQGRVVFTRHGSIGRRIGYGPFLRDLAR